MVPCGSSANKSMIIGSGYSFKGNKESQTVTMKTEEDFVKALNGSPAECRHKPRLHLVLLPPD